MSMLRRISSWLFLALAVLIVADAAAILTILLWPESDAGRWLACNEPVFRLLQASPLKSAHNRPSPPPEPRPQVNVRVVQGPHYVVVGAGHPIFERPDIHSLVIGEVQRDVKLPTLAEQEGWFLLEFSIGRGWVHSFVTSGPRAGAVGVRSGSPVLEPPVTEGEGALKQMKVQIFAGVDGQAPDSVALDGSLLDPSAAGDLFGHYSSSDLASLPLGVDPERLLLATRLMGEDVGELRYGEFIIRYHDRSWAEEAQDVLKNLRKTYLETFAPIIPEGAGEKNVFVLLMPSFDSYQEFYPEARSGRGGAVRTAGHYESGIIALYPDPYRGRATLSTLVHEATHHFNHTILGFPRDRSVLWLDEGIANFFGNSVIERNGELKLGVIRDGIRPWRGAGDTPRYKLPGFTGSDNPPLARILLLQDQMRHGWRFRFEELLSREGRLKFYSGNLVRNYSIAWMLVHFLMEGKDGGYREPFMRYITEEIRGRGSVETLERVFQVPCERIEEELRNYVLAK